jgi:type IV secretion system protein VirB3
MEARNGGLTADPLFVGLTRPPMRWGVTYSGLLLNGLFTMEAFLLTQNLLWLLAWFPIHLVCYLLCLYDPNFFELFRLWGVTRLAGHFGNLRFWQANSYSPLPITLPDAAGKRPGTDVAVWV